MRCMKVVLPLPAMPTQTIVTGGCAPVGAVVAESMVSVRLCVCIFLCMKVKNDELLSDENHH